MEFFDVALRALAVLGLPGVLIFWLRDRRSLRIQNNASEAKTPYKIRATAATTLDVEVAALQKAFDVDKSTRNDTIAYLKAELVDTRMREEQKDARNAALQETVTLLQGRVQQLQVQVGALQSLLNDVSAELADIKDIED